MEEAARITGLLHVITIPPDGDGDGGGFSVIFKEIDIVALSPSNSKDVLEGAG